MIRAFQWDLARQTERLNWLLRQLPRYADWGYSQLYLHLEDAVDYPSVPGVGRADAYSYRDLERLVAAAGKIGIGVVPIVNLLGHTQYLIKVPRLRELNERRSPDGGPLPTGQLCPVHPGTQEVAARLLRDVSPFCTAGRVHVGLDESFALGQHPLSQKEIAEVGLAGHFGRYVQRLERLCGGLKLQMGMWADMLALLPAAVKYLPRGVAAYDWYYYPFRRLPAVELYNFREYDLVPALRRQGVEYWGCPLSSGFRFEPMPTFGDRLANARDWWRRCQRVGAAGMLVTAWEETNLAAPVAQAVDAAIAGLWLDNRVSLTEGFLRAFGVARREAKRMAQIAAACDKYPYAGYYKWEIGEDWSTAARGDGQELETEYRYFKRLARRAEGLSKPFAAAIRFREYLAARDTLAANSERWSRGSAERTFKAGIRAAREMWNCSRRKEWGRGVSPALAKTNELRVLEDWARWKRHLAGEREESRVGGCVLCFLVENFAPALQKVVVEVEGVGGGWEVVRSRFTMEFTARGARRRARGLVRPLGVILPDPLPRRLRIGVRGLGEVKVTGFQLSRGSERIAMQGAGPKTIGKRAPSRGFPVLEWNRNLGRTLTLVLPPGGK